MAVAHSILIIGYAMLKTGAATTSLTATTWSRSTKILQRYFLKRLQRLGLTVTVEQQLE